MIGDTCISMDGSPCLYCLRNNRTSGLYDWTVQQGCTDCLQASHPLAHPCVSCNRNFKCRPWRRKYFSSTVPKWPWLNSVPWITLLLLLSNLFQAAFHILGRTISIKKSSRLLSYWVLLFITLFGGISLPVASCQGSLQPTPFVQSLQLPNAVVYVGSAFIYNISEGAFDCEVDSIVVSTVKPVLSDWH